MYVSSLRHTYDIDNSPFKVESYAFMKMFEKDCLQNWGKNVFLDKNGGQT